MKTIITSIILLLFFTSCKDITKNNGDLICLGIPAPEPMEEKIKPTEKKQNL